ncbi:MAG: hypothetical protein PHP83_00525 [Clostridia bacterium]|nr:hypothetical protein [Clostridia bacterium]
MDITLNELIFNEKIEDILKIYLEKNKNKILRTKNTYSDIEDIKQELIFYSFSKLESFDNKKETFEQFCEYTFDEKLRELQMQNKMESDHVNLGNDINLINYEM